MKTLGKLFLFAPLFAFLLLSCSKDDPDPLYKEGGSFRISELVGAWEATSATFSGYNKFKSVVGEGGTVALSVRSSGRFTLTIDPADRADYMVAGEMFWEEFEGKFYFAIAWDDYPGDWDTYGASLNNNNNRFGIDGGLDSGEYDFNGDGTFESASISFVFWRL